MLKTLFIYKRNIKLNDDFIISDSIIYYTMTIVFADDSY